MKNEQIIEVIIDKINDGYDDYEIEKFLERQEINLAEFDALMETAKNRILEHQLKTYPKQNKSRFIFWLVLFILSFLFFFIIMPLLNVTNGIIPIAIFGAFTISLFGFYSLLYYKSWEKDFIEKVGKPKFNLQTYILLSSLPTILFYFIISWNFFNGPGHNLYRLGSTVRIFKQLFH